ncbi:lon-related putative ATP-dependent protease [Alkalithermobacter thermoalcaliphilus JW-YL-7 = DSM 7308]|uniref:endopeptidase La n=1 Tax=Alkalithermobacter thermoalcaliphilus JW-YL-7 = DSM 7308 TaxID=1121328 RepID=A0A150FNT8_CLOPD|nr:peptidase S16 lon domain protein [[Clostridium] paradoxum JW-YL-7 = DSM 7308]SHK84371.1 lon-related putative ATP-dependent protease [[Clostridium] paradoxum JW-YL-7 = DSM 7308]
MKFKTTAELEPLKEILGQDKAINAMEFGLSIDDIGYNIYISGETGTGRTTYALEALKNYSRQKDSHLDWCYVYNFENPHEPIALSFQRGVGRKFKKDVDALADNILSDFRNILNSEEYEKERNQILTNYEIQKQMLIQQIKDYGKEKGFNFKSTQSGIVFIPIDENVDSNSKEFLESKIEIENMTIGIISKIKQLEEDAKNKIASLEESIAISVVDPYIKSLIKKYGKNSKVKKYLLNMREDILNNIYIFYMDDEELQSIDEREYFLKYKVNLFIDNGKEKNIKNAPVVLELNPIYPNLFGKVEYENDKGVIKTDFTKIIPGSIHKANGGYLVLYINELLKSPYSWDLLKRTLQFKKIQIDTATSMKPEPIPLDIKIVLIGSQYLYDLLYYYDEEFSKYFKVLVDFSTEMARNEENELKVARFISNYCNKMNLKHFTYDAVQVVLKHSSRLAQNRKKLSTRFNKIKELIIESNLFADRRNSEFVDKEDVKNAIYEKINRINKIEKKLDEMYQNNKLLISLGGKKIGVINGLSVISMGEYSFGRPAVITVTTSPGHKGVINIEREVRLSGAIHDKGVLILGGYLLENFSKEVPVSITSHICFEQSYSCIDGDSASSAELYALLSSLSEVPIKQNIAVTGSVNQKGDIQVVGGVTEKVEGFFNICKIKGLTGDQGVIIPKNNLDNLVLTEEIENAIKNGLFKIYPVDRIEEAMEILTDTTFEQICDRINKRLKKFYEMSK